MGTRRLLRTMAFGYGKIVFGFLGDCERKQGKGSDSRNLRTVIEDNFVYQGVTGQEGSTHIHFVNGTGRVDDLNIGDSNISVSSRSIASQPAF